MRDGTDRVAGRGRQPWARAPGLLRLIPLALPLAVGMPRLRPAMAGDPPPAAAPAARKAAAPDLDLLLRVLAYLRGDPEFGGVAIPEVEALKRMLLEDLPAPRRPQVANGLVDVRMFAAIAMELSASIDVRLFAFRGVGDAEAFLVAKREASELEDARKAAKSAELQILEASYEAGAGPKGRMPGFVVRKGSTRNGHAHRSLTQVARLGALVVVLKSMDLVDLDRPQLDEALVRVEAALLDPEAARRRSDRTPVFLRVLGPTMSIRALDAEGRGVPRFALRVQWEKEPGHFQTWGGYGEDGVATARVPRVPSTVEVWGAQDADGRSLPSGPASAEAVAGATSVEVRLPKGLALAGRLVSREGQPLGGIRVVAFPADAGTLGIPAAKLPPGGLGVGAHGFEAHGADTPGADGRFTLQGLAASRYRVTVAAEGEWYTVNDVEADAGSGPIEVVVERSLSPEVKVLDPHGNPLVGATVAPYPVEKGHFSAGYRSDLAATTDARGVARLRRLQANGTYRLSVVPPDERKDLAPTALENWSPAPTTVHLPARK